MFDCGISYKRLEDDLNKTKYLFLTHTHTDHIKKATLSKIKKNYPEITIFGNSEVVAQYPDLVDVRVSNGVDFMAGNRKITPFRGVHDVMVTGYVFTMKGNRCIYCTDSANFDNAPDEKYDYFFIESNYDVKKIRAIEKSRGGGYWKYGYDVVGSAKRHCSKQKSKGFYFSHRRNKDSKYIELHQSARFY